MRKLDLDFDAFVQSRISLFRSPDTSIEVLYIPTPVNFQVVNQTIVMLLDECKNQKMLTTSNPRMVALYQYAMLCLFSYTRDVMITEHASRFERAFEKVLEIAGALLMTMHKFPTWTLADAVRSMANALINTSYAVSNERRRKHTMDINETIKEELIQVSCHPKRYIQCLDTEDLRAWTGHYAISAL